MFIVFKNDVRQKISSEYSIENNDELIQVKSFSRGFIMCSRSGVFSLYIQNTNKDEDLFIF